ncbi:MAG: hypothetical protein IJ948_02355 [Clostridia bacterium]|nr:hypothetical protein [Clostridia bacterium]
MKKLLCVHIVVALLCLSACNIAIPNKTDTTTIDTPSSSTTEAIPIESNPLPLSNDGVEFAFLSGAGAWRTIITLNRDGTFTGWYLDSEMGETGEGYPKGSAYTCDFSGKFENIEKLNEYSYKMTLTDVETNKAVGEEWIEDEIRYVASAPHGLNDPINNQECTEFVFFLPDTPINQVPEEFLSWWPYRYTQETARKTTLSCYGILNTVTNFGFFTSE